MEDALKQERDMLENMAESMDAGLTLIGRDYRVLWANQLLKQIHGNDLENKLCYSIYDHSNRTCPDCGVRKVFENGVTVDRHDYNFKFNDRDEWVELIVTPVKDKDGNVVAALELAVNITERRRLQNKLAEYSQRLEELVQERTEQLKKMQAELVKSERLAAIGELASMVGHDLRNPLTGIKNSAYFLKKKGPEISQAQAKEMLEVIDRCVDYSNKIVNDLLDYSREIRLELQECSLRQLMLESLAMVQVPEKVEIVNALSRKQTLKADPDKIKRVFVNLIRNAIDAMPKGGKLTINGKVNGNFEVSFKDTGTGINGEVLPKLFSPLFTTKAKGMGFGLAICKRIVEAHGGKITVKTAKDLGTTFTVILPIEPKFEIGGENVWINTPESSSSMMTKT
jgi:PAS domain S-box-containing protein